MVAKLRNHLLLALIFLLLTLGQQYAFYAVKGMPIVFLSVGKYLGMYGLFLLLTFIKGEKTRFGFLSMLLLLNFFQMGHLSFFGTQILPAEFYLFFTQFHEIQGTLKEEFQHILVPLLFTVVPVLLGFFAQRKLAPHYRFRAVAILISLYLFYNPIRTYVTGNTWGRQPSTRELTGMNVYLSFSYFLGKILPYKLSQAGAQPVENTSLKLELKTGAAPAWDKIIVVLGESLTPRHMQLFGYERPTTPFLEKLKGTPNFAFLKGLSGGVSTDIAVAYFMNLGFGSAGGVKAAKGNHCLFRLAREKNLTTHFVSIQSAEQLRYISPYLCSSFLNESLSLENVSPATPDHQAARDRDLMAPLKKLLAAKDKKFIMLHQRGSHSPWQLRYTKEAKKFKNGNDWRTDAYDNSVVEFDLFWKELHGLLGQTAEKVLVVYLSDHGESLGDDGKWGHGFIGPAAFEVPVLVQSYNVPLPEQLKAAGSYITHYNVGLLLAKELGYEMNQAPMELPKDYEIYGNDIDGFAGKAKIKFNGNEYLVEHQP